MTGIASGDNSPLRLVVNASRPDTMLLSGAWKAGLRLGMIDGVRITTLGCG